MPPLPVASSVTVDGLWLIGIGALLVVSVALTATPPRLHLQFGGLGDQRKDRLAPSIATTGLIATAAGSVLVSVGSVPAIGFVGGVVVALGIMAWGLLARQVRLLWRARQRDAMMRLRENQDLARETWEVEAATILAGWRWALLHPLSVASAEGWPMSYLRTRIGEAPPGIPAEWYSPQGRQLRYNKPSLVRMTADDAPRWLRDIVVVALAEGWFVLGNASFLTFYAPDGLGCETIGCDHPEIVHLLVRQALLARLKRLGLPSHRGTRGQMLPARNTNDLIKRLVEAGPCDAGTGDAPLGRAAPTSPEHAARPAE